MPFVLLNGGTINMSTKYSNEELSREIAEKTGLYRYQVREVILLLIKIIISQLCSGKKVNIISLGTFWLKKYPERDFWDPQRNKKVRVGERLLPRFNFGRRAFAFIRQEAAKIFNGSGSGNPGEGFSGGEQKRI